MAFFKRKREPEPEGPVDHRSKRGGARRQTGEIQVDLSELDRRAAPAPGMAPEPRVGPAPPGAKTTTRRMAVGAATFSVSAAFPSATLFLLSLSPTDPARSGEPPSEIQ